MTARLALPLVLALAACGKGAPAPAVAEQRDPAIVAALADPIMIDPDLASQNRGNAVIALESFAAVPLDAASPEAIAAAEADASRLTGGMIKTAPGPAGDDQPFSPALTAGQVAASLPGNPAGCLEGLRYGYGWAASLRPELPIYPRGHIEEAAGNTPCGLRAVVFTTPVEPAAVIDFYFTRAGGAGYSADRRRAGGADVLSGSKGGAAYLVRVREVDGLSQVELAVRN
ncbi:MAG: hypothetical protein ACTHLU_03220 [Novosphingobium sp.]